MKTRLLTITALLATLPAWAIKENSSEAITISPNWKLLEASCLGNLADIEQALEGGANINTRASTRNTPLHYAIRWQQYDAAELLLTRGANIELQGANNETPLHQAVQRSSHAIVELLLERGANVLSRDGFYWTPIHLAALRRDTTVLEQLLLRLQTISNHTLWEEDYTPIDVAVRGNAPEALELLLEQQGVQLSQEQANELRSHASARGYAEIAYILILRGGATLGMLDTTERITPLHFAADEGHDSVVLELLDLGVEINAATYSNHTTAMHLAALHGHWRTLFLLLWRGGNPNVRTIYNETPLHLAVASGDARSTELLLFFGAEIDAEYAGGTALHIAAEGGHEATARLLLENTSPPDVDARDELGWTPLHIAAYHGHLNLIQLLHENNADMNAQTTDGQTPADIAAGRNHVAAAAWLQDHESEEPIVIEEVEEHNVISFGDDEDDFDVIPALHRVSAHAAVAA